MKHQPERTCIGCRGVFNKDRLVRIVPGPDGAVLDYREKLAGRAAYVCPRSECVEKAVSRGNLSRALRMTITSPAAADIVTQLAGNINEKIKSLISISAKAGKLAAGYSAVRDALEKRRAELLVYARDISEGTKEKVVAKEYPFLREVVFLTRDELGRVLSRELVGVVALLDKGLADAVWKETERLKGLININE